MVPVVRAIKHIVAVGTAYVHSTAPCTAERESYLIHIVQPTGTGRGTHKCLCSLCLRPDHVELGTAQENSTRMRLDAPGKPMRDAGIAYFRLVPPKTGSSGLPRPTGATFTAKLTDFPVPQRRRESPWGRVPASGGSHAKAKRKRSDEV